MAKQSQIEKVLEVLLDEREVLEKAIGKIQDQLRAASSKRGEKALKAAKLKDAKGPAGSASA